MNEKEVKTSKEVIFMYYLVHIFITVIWHFNDVFFFLGITVN